MVGVEGIAPSSPAYQADALLLSYEPVGAASGFRPRVLLVGNEASYWLDYGREFFSLPGQESNLQLAVSKKEVPGRLKSGPGVRNRTSYPQRAPALQAGSDPTRKRRAACTEQ